MDKSSKFEPLNLAGRGFWKLRKKLHPVRAFVDWQASEYKLLQFPGEVSAAIRAIPEHHARYGFGKFVRVLTKDDCDFQHQRMLAQHAFDLDRTHPNSAYFDHVVGSAGIPEISVFVLMVFVAGT